MFLFLVFSVFAFTCAQDCTNTRCQLQDISLRFNIIGDWGGIPIWPYHSWTQSTVAEGMGQWAERMKTHFQLALGDNFYITGVSSVDDHRFKQTFENVYTAKSLFTPWYVLAGNHDHYGNVTAQLAYTKKSARWMFPNLYYTVRYQLSDSTTIDLIIIDTVTLCGNNKPLKNAGFFKVFFTRDQELTGPGDPEDAGNQWTWLITQLRASNANYVFVAGHFPVYSIGEHGPTQCLVDGLLPLLTQYKVSAYLDGHDHDLQHLKHTKNGWTTHYVISGMGALADDSKAHESNVPSGSLQFHYPDKSNFVTQFFQNGAYVYAAVSKENVTFRYLNGKNKELYTFSVGPRTQ